MTAVELKDKIIAKISDTDNEELLDQISRLIEVEEQAGNVYKLSPDELSAVNEGIAQIESGLFVTNEEASKIINKCLGR
jgi:predicted transcriptional regulator